MVIDESVSSSSHELIMFLTLYKSSFKNFIKYTCTVSELSSPLLCQSFSGSTADPRYFIQLWMEVPSLQTSLLLQTLHVLPGLPSSLTNTHTLTVMKPLEEIHLATDMYTEVFVSLTTWNESLPHTNCVCCFTMTLDSQVTLNVFSLNLCHDVTVYWWINSNLMLSNCCSSSLPVN